VSAERTFDVDFLRPVAPGISRVAGYAWQRIERSTPRVRGRTVTLK
jgi:hypothetical protein